MKTTELIWGTLAILMVAAGDVAMSETVKDSPTVDAESSWPQAAGPNANWKVPGCARTEWSVVRKEHIGWKTTLPEGGQSAVTVWGDRAFLTSHVPLESSGETNTSTDIRGYCLDARSGDILWTIDVPGSVAVGTAGIFSDSTVFAPVTDGELVWFFNRSGAIACCDLSGKQIWLREYVPRNRHTNRQCEPILFGDQIITVEVVDKDAGAKIKRHQAVPKGIDPKSVWTCLHGIDKRTGKVRWIESAGTVCHHTPMLGRMADGTPAIVHARGGGHGPLESPYGISLTSLATGHEGTTLWSTAMTKLDPPFNSHWNQEHIYAFHRADHVVLATETGKELSRRDLNQGVDLWKRDEIQQTWNRHHVNVKAGRTHANTNQTNIVVGEWHYFLAHNLFAIGRVNVRSGKVEYLEVPLQIEVSAEQSRWIWQQQSAIPIDVTNSRGIQIAPDKRASRSGWGHVSAASPILVGKYLYFPVMTGTVYVVDTTAKQLNGDALVAINDLGPAGSTWTLSSFSHSSGRLFIRTLKEVICIEKPLP